MQDLTLTKADEKRETVNKKIKVMHIIDKLSVSGSQIHGVSRVVERWIKHMDRNVFEFYVVSLRKPEPARAVFENLGVEVFFLSRNKFDPRTISDLVKLMKEKLIDVVHLHGYGAANFGRIASRITKVPNVLQEHVVIQNQPFYQTIADSLFSSFTDKALAVSDPVLRFMITERKIKKNLAETVICGIPLDDFKIPDKSTIEKERSELGISPDYFIVSNIGRLDTQKGQIYFLQSAKIVLEKLPDKKLKFLIVGDGPDMKMLKSYTEENGISDNVIFTGYRENVQIVFELSDIFAMPSLFEGFPIALLEAMNMQKPIVAFPAEGIVEAIQDGVNGFLVPFKDVKMMADKIIYLLENPDKAEAMGKKAKEDCQKYDISHSVKRLSEIYKELAN